MGVVMDIDINDAVDRLCCMAREIDTDPTRNHVVLLESRKKDRQLLLDVASILQSLRVLSK
jgi:hypothetical protein